jgi:hypothetical protein
LLSAVAAVLCFLPACKRGAAPAGGPKPATIVKTNALPATNHLALEFRSVFEDQLMPPRGRDPFFPNSHRRDPTPAPRSPGEKPPPASGLMLKGVVGSPKHRLAVINNAILEVNEEGQVQVPGGRVRVKCLEIGEDFAVVKADGESQPKRLELKRKDF